MKTFIQIVIYALLFAISFGICLIWDSKMSWILIPATFAWAVWATIVIYKISKE